MIDLLISFIVLCVVFGLIYWLVQQLPLPDPFPKFIRIAVILIFILLLLGVMFGGVAVPHLNLRN